MTAPPDLAAVDEDLLGPLAEGVGGQRQRLALGQYFTPTPLVDLVLAFCVRRADDRVLDPACGSGAFLVRAFARKRELPGDRTAAARVADLAGVDAAALPAALALHNLAIRGNGQVPRVYARDFFSIPPPDEGGPLAPVDAVVGNPPWVQQESLKATKAVLRARARAEGCVLSGRSDLHAYFWPRAARFLRPRGRLGLVTSAQWLDAGYGDALRRWLVEGFDVELILDSLAEPWFPGARVDSVVTVLRRRAADADGGAPARLVRLRRPLSELLGAGGDTRAAMARADALRDAIEAEDGDREGLRYRVRLLPRSALSAGGDGRAVARWGGALRRPAIWDRLRRATQGRWTTLGRRCRVRRGVTSGGDGYFYLRDVSDEWLARWSDDSGFRRATGAPRPSVARGALRLVTPGDDGPPIPLESAALRPAIHGPLELSLPRLEPTAVTRHLLWLDRDSARAPHAARYLARGEALGIAARPTCAERASSRRAWFDLTRPRRPGLLWTKERQFRHLVVVNEGGVVPNCRLYEIVPDDGDELWLWGGILHSSWGLLSCLVHGRPLGTEAVWSTMVGEVRGMAVPDPRRAEARDRERVEGAFRALADRPAAPMLSGAGGELGRTDRRALDDAVLGLLGVAPGGARDRLVDALHAHLGRHFDRLRRKEARAVARGRRRRQRR